MKSNKKILLLISNNPYRILGAFSNASKKDILSNTNKLNAFSKVGKSIDFPSDFSKILGTIDRTIDSVEKATKETERAIDRLKATMFWFTNQTPIDQIAFNNLKAGNVLKAMQIWEKKECLSSLLNLSVCSLICADYYSTAHYMDRLIQIYGGDLCGIVDETLLLSTNELIELYIDTLINYDDQILNKIRLKHESWPLVEFAKFHGEIKVTDELKDEITGEKYKSCSFIDANNFETLVGFDTSLGELTLTEIIAQKDELIVIKTNEDSYKLFSSKAIKITSKQWRKILKKKIVSRIVNNVDSKISASKIIDSKNPIARYESGICLLKLSQEILPVIKDITGEEAIEFTALSDKLAREILQCGIDYHNNTLENEEDPTKALKLQEYALSIAVGTMVKARCQENVEIMRGIIKKMPPQSVSYYHKLLKARIASFYDEPSSISIATKFIRDCAPYIMSIKTVLGDSNEYYLRMSTKIAADALSDIITDYNERSNKIHERIRSASNSEGVKLFKEFILLVKEALIALYNIKSLDFETDFYESRFIPNFNTIIEQAEKCGVLNNLHGIKDADSINYVLDRNFKNEALDMRDEDGYFNAIDSLADCYEYRRIFPNGKYTTSVLNEEEKYEYDECSSMEDVAKFQAHFPNSKFDIEQKKEDIIFNSCKTINDYYDYLTKYTRYSGQAYNHIDNLKYANCKTREDYCKYINEFPKGNHIYEAQNKVDDIDFNKCKTIEDYKEYLKQHPHGRNNGRAKQYIEDEELWIKCKKQDSWKSYKEYIDKFPSGRHANEAKDKAFSPTEKFKKWSSNNGCLLTIIIILVGAIIYGALTEGIVGVGYVFAIIAFLGFGLFVSKGDTGCALRIVGLIIAVIAGSIAYGLINLGEQLNRKSKASSALENIESSPSTIQDYRSFFKQYNQNIDNDKRTELARQYYLKSLDSCYATIDKYNAGGYNSSTLSGLGYLKDYLDICPESTYNIIALKKYESLVDSLYYMASVTNTHEGWLQYQKSVSTDDYRDSDDMLEATDTSWNTEAAAWQTALKNNNIRSYQLYIELYPSGKHKDLADKKLIDAQVAQTFAGAHGTLPSMDKTSYSGGSTTYISVYNRTSYTMTLLYSGVDSKRLVLAPNSEGNLRLKNGSYLIAASVNASDVSDYAGNEDLDGGSYEVEYYISTSSYKYH
jgi:hypothetical protein